MSCTASRVLVTGAARGLGRAIAVAFAAEGASVAAADLPESAAAQSWTYPLSTPVELGRTVAEIDAAGGKGLAVEVDVTDSDSCQGAVRTTVDAFGGLDVLVNCAGLLEVGPFEQLPIELWDRMFAVNVRGAFLMARSALEALGADGSGNMVNVSSVCGKVGFAQIAAYCASKFALVGLTQSLALELAPRQIRVNCVCPGLVPTAMMDHIEAAGTWSTDDATPAEARRNAAAAMFPSGRFQTPEDVAQATLYLASAPSVTGISLPVAGGQLLT